jgi:hypothetical protein
VAPLERVEWHVVRPEGHVAQQRHKEVSAPLEHLVHPEGHVVLLFNKWINLYVLRTNNVLRKIKNFPIIKCRRA